MEAKTVTTLGELRIGDSFVYSLSRGDVWRVMAMADKNKRVAVNQIDPRTRKPVWKHDELKKANKKVVFLRHTVPVAGEPCLIDDLVPGDIFKRPEDSVHEWMLVNHGHMFSDVRRTDEPACGKAGKMAQVIFLRHKED